MKLYLKFSTIIIEGDCKFNIFFINCQDFFENNYKTMILKLTQKHIVTLFRSLQHSIFYKKNNDFITT